MKVVYNRFIPFKGFVAINLCGLVFVRKDGTDRMTFEEIDVMLKHELVHSEQMQRDGYVRFYCKYLYEYLRGIIRYRNATMAYHLISYEIEAYEKQNSPNYNNKVNR